MILTLRAMLLFIAIRETKEHSSSEICDIDIDTFKVVVRELSALQYKLTI